MQAITTRFIPASNYRGSRIKATCERGSITVSADSEYSRENLHWQAVKALVQRFAAEDAKRHPGDKSNPWLRPMVCGGIFHSRSDAYVFVFADGDKFAAEGGAA